MLCFPGEEIGEERKMFGKGRGEREKFRKGAIVVACLLESPSM